MYLEEDSSIEERLYAQELGWKVLDYVKIFYYNNLKTERHWELE